MKKLFLSSSFNEVSAELLLLEKDVYGKTVTFIPTASNVEKIKSYVTAGRKALEKMGVIVDVVDVSVEPQIIIEQHNLLDHRRLYLMLFEDGNRIDLTLCPKEHIKEWVDSEADFTVLV